MLLCLGFLHHMHRPSTSISYLCGVSAPVLLGVVLGLLTERELQLQVVTAMESKYGTVVCGNEDKTSEEADLTSKMKSFENRVLLCPFLVHFSTCCVCRKYTVAALLFGKRRKKTWQSTKYCHKSQGKLRFGNKMTEF